MDEYRDTIIDDTQSITILVIIIAPDFNVHGYSEVTVSADTRVGDMLEAVRKETGGFAPESNFEDFEFYRKRQPIPISNHPARHLEKAEGGASPTPEQDASTLESRMLNVLVENLRSRGMHHDLVEKVDWRAQTRNYFQPLPEPSFRALLRYPASKRPSESCAYAVLLFEKGLAVLTATGNKRSHEPSSDRTQQSKKPKLLPRQFTPSRSHLP